MIIGRNEQKQVVALFGTGSMKTDHFQRYKQGTLHMVKNLNLPTMKPLDPEAMKMIFKKLR